MDEMEQLIEGGHQALIYLNLQGEMLWSSDRATTEMLGGAYTYRDFKNFYEWLETRGLNEGKNSSKQRPLTSDHSQDGNYKFSYQWVMKQGALAGIGVYIKNVSKENQALMLSGALFKMSKLINESRMAADLYMKGFEIIRECLPMDLFCITGKDYDSDYIEFCRTSDAVSYETLRPMLEEVLESVLVQCKEDDGVIIKIDDRALLIFPIGPRILTILVPEHVETDPPTLKFLNSIVEQLKIGLKNIENHRYYDYQIHHDISTGLYNRAYFSKALDAKLQCKRRGAKDVAYGLAMIDLNHFKYVNDTYSHLSGDEVLGVIAQRLKKSIRNTDIVARVGGDEFAVLFAYTNKKEIHDTIRRLQEVIAEPVILQSKYEILIGSSVGIVCEIGNYGDARALMIDADKAMYEAKKDKRGVGSYIFYEKSIQKKMARQMEMESLLDSINMHDRFELVYQPIVDLKKSKVVGVEGFLRWHSHNGQLIPPADFMPFAKEHRGFKEISRQVMDMAVETLDQLEEEQFVTINMTIRELLDYDQLYHLKESLAKGNYSSGRLHIDLEQRFRDNQMQEIQQAIKELADFGAYIDLDDFSIKDSSLDWLIQLEIDEIKLDREFIRQWGRDDKVKKKVKGLRTIADAMGIKITAEGIETKKDLEWALAMGCDYGQGYFFAKPSSLKKALNTL